MSDTKTETTKLQEPKLTTEDANLLLTFLDKVPVTGHQTRNQMQAVCNKLIQILNYKPDKQ